jgi:anaerobic selenocysteine-containing dehydrogenase
VASNGQASEPTEEPVEQPPMEQLEVAATQSQGETVQAETEPPVEAPLQPGATADPPSQEPGGGGVPLLSFSPVAATTASPPVDAYSLRLVSSRSLYDAGVLVQESPALAQLVPGARLRAHPSDLGRLGVSTGDSVRVSSSRGSLTLTAVADRSVLRGSAVLAFNQPGPGAAELIDASLPITDVRVETVGAGPADR